MSAFDKMWEDRPGNNGNYIDPNDAGDLVGRDLVIPDISRDEVPSPAPRHDEGLPAEFWEEWSKHFA